MQKELCGGAREVGDEKRWRDLRIEQEKCRSRGGYRRGEEREECVRGARRCRRCERSRGARGNGE